jgi:hypothetical protein
MHGRSAAAMSWRSGANHWKRASHKYNFASIAELGALATLAVRGKAPMVSLH